MLSIITATADDTSGQIPRAAYGKVAEFFKAKTTFRNALSARGVASAVKSNNDRVSCKTLELCLQINVYR